MKSNFVKNLDYKNLVLTILVTLFVFTFSLKIDKHLKMFFLLISLFICIYDLRYLIPFLVTFLIVTLNKEKNSVEHFSIRDNFDDVLNNSNLYNTETNTIKNNFNKNLKNIPFFSNSDNTNSIFKQIITLKTQNSEFRLFTDTLPDNEKRIYINRIIKRINPTPELLFDMLGLNDNDSLNVNRNSIVSNLDLMGDSKNKKIGLLFSFSRKRKFNNFMFKISKQLGLSELYNNNLSPVRPNVRGQTNIQIINENYNYVQNLYINLRKKLLEAIIFIFIENIGSENINNIINDDNLDFFEYDFNIENYLEVNSDIKISNTFFRKLKKIVEFDFNCFSNDFMLINFRNTLTTLPSKLAEFYRQNSNRNKLILSSNFNQLVTNLDNSLTNTPINRKVIRYLNDYEREIKNKIEELNLLDNILRPIRDPQMKNSEKLKILFNLYSVIILTNTDLRNILNTKLELPSINNSIDVEFNNIKNNLEIKLNEDTLTTRDIFNNQIFFNLKIIENIPDYFIEGIFDENLEPSFEPPEPSLDEQPRWYNDSELKKFFDVNEMNDKKENQLEKYYRAMDFNNPNLAEISKQAKIQQENAKIEKLSFNHVIDNFSTNTYEIIDEMKELLEKIVKGESGFKENVNEFINILTKEDRELSIGFILICLGILIYFMEDNSPRNEISVVDYLSQIKI